jgi:exopolyphosphatase/guanosine-5'-triphosphate,3'-diphosphate pyrophosphatase
LKVGIIDLGTNTFGLLIAEIDDVGGYTPIYRSKIGVKLGEGSFQRNYITEEATERALVALEAQLGAIKNQYCDKVLAFATAALRNASNAAQFVDRVREQLGMNIHIISGEQEADMIYNGVQLAGILSRNSSLILDIGGGSTEFIIANDEEILWKKSYDIGVTRMLEQIEIQDPLSDQNKATIQTEISDCIKEVQSQLTIHKVHNLVGSSGSFDTFKDILEIRAGKEPPETPDPSGHFVFEDFTALLDELIKSTRQERQLMRGMADIRIALIPLSSLLIRTLLESHPFNSASLSRYALKEGVLFDVLKGNI